MFRFRLSLASHDSALEGSVYEVATNALICLQHLTPSFLRPKFQEDLDRLKGVPGWKMADFDATTSYWVTDADKLRAMISDPDWEGKVVKFEKGWTDTSKAYVQAGWETVYPGHGEGDH